MRVRSGLGFVLLAVLLSLTPLAQASPPDPTWIPGIYDGGDLDDVIDSLTAESAVAPEPRGPAIPALRVGGLVQLGAGSAHPAPASRSFQGRAPPALTSS